MFSEGRSLRYKTYLEVEIQYATHLILNKIRVKYQNEPFTPVDLQKSFDRIQKSLKKLSTVLHQSHGKKLGLGPA